MATPLGAPRPLYRAEPHHEDFCRWSLNHGVRMSGIGPVRFPGRGTGMAAFRHIRAGEVILYVEASSLLSLDTIPASFKDQFPPETPVQALFATYLTCNDEARVQYAKWQSTWPTMQEFEESMPFFWLRRHPNEEHSKLFPPALSGHWNTLQKNSTNQPRYRPLNWNLFARQRETLDKALHYAKLVYPSLDEHDFTYFWFVAHTRCFHYVSKDTDMPVDRNDAMAMCPIADYFNHADEPGCSAEFTEHGYYFRATRDFAPGEEIYICYGNHTDDLLLTDYGFLPEENKWDAVFLDDIILDEITEGQKATLEENNFLGNYELMRSGPCFRTEVAASLLWMTPENWNKYTGGNLPHDLDDMEKTDTIIAGWIQKYLKEADVAKERIRVARAGGQYETIFSAAYDRWTHIEKLFGAALDHLGFSANELKNRS